MMSEESHATYKRAPLRSTINAFGCRCKYIPLYTVHAIVSLIRLREQRRRMRSERRTEEAQEDENNIIMVSRLTKNSNVELCA